MLPIQSVSYFLYFSRHKWNISSSALHKTVLLCFVYLFVVVQFVFIFVGLLVFSSATENSQFYLGRGAEVCDVTSVPPAPVTRCNLPFSSSFICLCEKTRRAFPWIHFSCTPPLPTQTPLRGNSNLGRIQGKIYIFSLSVFLFFFSIVLFYCHLHYKNYKWRFHPVWVCISDS